MNVEKCIIFGCSNCKHRGSFNGDICSPCYHYITTGRIGSTDSFLGKLTNKRPEAFAKTSSGYHLFVKEDDLIKWLGENKSLWESIEHITNRVTWHGIETCDKEYC